MSCLRSAVVAVVVSVLGLPAIVACSADDDRGGAPATTTAVSPSTTPSGEPAAGDSPGILACDQAKAAITDATLMNPGVASAIAQTAATADAPIADSAERLLGAYDTAVAAHGTDGEPDAVAAVSAAGADLAGVCDDSGFLTTG